MPDIIPSRRKKSQSEISRSGYNTLQEIDKRLLNSKDAREIVLWTSVRKEIIKQNESVERPKHKRKLEFIQVIFKNSFSLVSFITGVILLVYGFAILAPFLIGAGLFAIAPEFVMAYLTKTQGEKNE